jgi:hypothetical protein
MHVVWVTLAIAIAGSSFSPASDPPPRLEFVGTFSSFRQTPEHVYGHQLTIWTDDGTPHAVWSRAQGEPADFPMVAVTDLSWDQLSGAIRFNARWCDAIESFRGTLGRDVRGTLETDGHSARLTLIRGDTASLGREQRSEWEAFVATELKRRRPKC